MKKMFILVTALALVAAACGDSDTADTTTTTAAPTTTTTVAPTTTTTVAPTTTTTTEPEMMDLIGTAAAAGNFTTLLAAADAAGLTSALASAALGPVTIFAPTDEAFAALPEGTLDGLLTDTEALTGVLTYHAILGEVLAADVVTLETATMLNGLDISIEVVDGTVVINGVANVIATDIVTSTGIIHVIDTVLIPSAP